MLSLVAATAMAEQCKPIHGQLGAVDVFLEDDPECKLDGMTFYWCMERPSLGTLAGRKRFIASPAFNGWDLDVPDADMGTTWVVSITYSFGVFETKKGMLFTEETGVWHGGAAVGWGSHSKITGGTGQYDGATGWMAGAGTMGWMTVVGTLCTP